MARTLTFDSSRGPDGKVRVGVWDRICVPGHDEKDGQSTDFDQQTLAQFVDNFLERGDPVPIDFNHQSNYAHLNGQPAPALGFYGALAVVWDGKIEKLGALEGVTAGAEGLDLSKDGLWGLRTEVTELGDQLLPNFKLLSPTFTPEGVRRDGTEVGYCLAAVAATNTPWQAGTKITFDVGTQGVGETNGGAAAKMQGASRMAKLAKLAKFAGVDEGADDSAIRAALAKKMSDVASAAMTAMAEDQFAYEDEAQKLEDAAAQFEGDSDEDEDKELFAKMSKMAAQFRRFAKMSKMSAAPAPAAPAASSAEMQVMQASLAAAQKQIEQLQASERARAKAAEREAEAKFEALAAAAVKGGYPAEAKGALIAFARSNYSAAEKSVAHFLPKTGAPAHLFERMTSQGGPVGAADTNARQIAGPPKPRKFVAMGHTFIENDAEFADEVKRVAQSKDPVVMAKVDALIPAKQRGLEFYRLMAADRVVRAERPDLAESAE